MEEQVKQLKEEMEKVSAENVTLSNEVKALRLKLKDLSERHNREIGKTDVLMEVIEKMIEVIK